MKKIYLIFISLFTILLFSGCSIKQEINPIDTRDTGTKEVCIIKNTAVRTTFLEAYKNALENKQYKVIIKEDNYSAKNCNIISTYTANWRWDLALYLVYAELNVYKQDNLVGKAIYDSLHGDANMNKFINAQEKIKELVDKLYP